MPKYLTCASLAVVLLGAGCTTRLAEVPDKLRPDASERLAMIVPAKGVQIYECRQLRDRVGAYEWSFVAPEAELFDVAGKSIGRHYGGPHWEASDGSKALGAVKARTDAPKADAIPWLLLGAKSVGADGQFSRVSSIQRVNTAGGIAPKGGCFEDMAGAVIRIPYSADYYFFSPQ
jgi:hypothetical protein